MLVYAGSLESEFIRLKIQIKQLSDIELSQRELTFLEQTAEQTLEPIANKRLNNLAHKFSLGTFEQQLILICLATQLDEEFSPLLAQMNPVHPYPTLALLLLLFKQTSSDATGFNCLMANKPLINYKIIEVDLNTNGYLYSPLKLAEDILQYLITDETITDETITDETITYEISDKVITPLLKPYWRQLSVFEPVLTSEQQNTDALQKVMSHNAITGSQLPLLPILVSDVKQQIALSYQSVALMAKSIKCKAYVIDLAWLPVKVEELEHFYHAIVRELHLQYGLLLLQADTLHQCNSVERSVWEAWLAKLALACPNQLIISAAQPLYFSGSHANLTMQPLPLLLPSIEEQQQLWIAELNQSIVQPYQWEQLTEYYCFNKQQIMTVAKELKLSSFLTATPETTIEPETNKIQPKQLWKACQLQQKNLLGEFVQVISPGSAGWDDIILSSEHISVLKAVVSQVKKRKQVYQEWGFGAEKSAYGLGISVLLSGDSGTGKTLAARIIANELQRDIYQIDLSQVADKYIGETEKNLEKIFKAAEHSGAILLFDEADALFGKRSKINDSKDRHANLGVSYLLQRMEAYQGISILTSNFKSALDEAFMRRIRFMVQFSFPNIKHRQNLWQQLFPKQAPKENLDFSKLARLSLTGGSIRNIVLQAAFTAASCEQPISMAHILSACRHEFDKTEKTLRDDLVADWVHVVG